VPDERVPELTVCQIPYLYRAVPRARDDGGVGGRRGEADAGDPVGMAFGIGLNGVLAFAEGVPQLDGAVAGGGDDLAVIYGERHAEYVLGVADEAPGGEASVEVPEAELSVPGGSTCRATKRRSCPSCRSAWRWPSRRPCGPPLYRAEPVLPPWLLRL